MEAHALPPRQMRDFTLPAGSVRWAAMSDPETDATARGASHALPATPGTCFWGYFDNTLAPVLEVESGDVVALELLTHQAGDAPDLMMDDGVRRVYDGIAPSERGPGVHIMTGPVSVRGAEPGDALQVDILEIRPRLAYGTNVAAWWGYLYRDFGKERVTIYHVDVDAAGQDLQIADVDLTLTGR
jgi:acetamidase/formamidase